MFCLILASNAHHFAAALEGISDAEIGLDEIVAASPFIV
jgi:hypothetical protein